MTESGGRGARAAFAVLLAVWCAAVWVLSAQPDPESYVGVRLRVPDKLSHAIEYAAGGLLAAGCLPALGRLPSWGAALLFSFLWGVSDEIHQGFVPGRDATAADVAADTAGGAAGALAFSWWARRRQTPGRRVDEPYVPSQQRRRT